MSDLSKFTDQEILDEFNRRMSTNPEKMKQAIHDEIQKLTKSFDDSAKLKIVKDN